MSNVADRARSARQVWAAPGSPHDKVVAGARTLLPAAIGVLTAFLVMAPLTTGGDVSFVLDKNKVDMATERMRLQSALYRGQDTKGQPFQLKAGSAVQKSSAEPIVRLNDLSANLSLPDGPAHIVAKTGRYDMDSEQVHVDGAIAVRAPDGYALDTQNSTLDLKTRKLQSGGAVTGTVRQGNFSGGQMDADIEQRVVRLSGGARLHIAAPRPR